MKQAVQKLPATQDMDIDGYIAFAQASGVFDDNAPAPENDARVWKEYYAQVRALYPEDGEGTVKVYLGRYGFFRDWIDAERPGLNWALSTPVIDYSIGIPFAQFQADAPLLRDAILRDGDVVIGDTFSFIDGYGDGRENESLVRLHSPVARIDTFFDTYLESLTSERRKKYRRMCADFESTGLRFDLSDKKLSAAELDAIRLNLEKKWGDEAGYAMRQILYAAAVQKIRPAQSLVMRVMDGNACVFTQTMIVKGDTVFCQSIAKDEEKFFSGLAAYTDFQCVRALCGRYQYFDASCRTSLEDPESIGVAKRATVNEDCIKPLLVLGADFAPAMFTTVQGKEA